MPAVSCVLVGLLLMYHGYVFHGQDVSSVDACPGEECELAFGGLVVVLDAQKP
ncbi:MAG: hypothetical protein QOI36_4548 [Pseudonocardiales bacterium]|jgi:hypothetical protein|nr:hypothetical protein [Pseudonocardia sp.]MDT7653142.1 hypothetical protein [Pseudonocardiales bacterium]